MIYRNLSLHIPFHNRSYKQPTRRILCKVSYAQMGRVSELSSLTGRFHLFFFLFKPVNCFSTNPYRPEIEWERPLMKGGVYAAGVCRCLEFAGRW